jgi:hypothetical protein
LLKLAGHIAGDKINPIALTPDQGPAKETPQGTEKTRRGLFRFVRREA